MARQKTNWSVEVSEEAGVRRLHFGSEWIQGAMRVARPWSLELDYTREMMAPLLMRAESWPRTVLIIGMGAGSVLKFLYRHRPQAHLTVVEINPEVVPVAHAAFRVPQDPQRITMHLADGAQFVNEASQQDDSADCRYDLIMVDGYDAQARAGALDTEAFYQQARQCLAPEGVLVANLFGRAKGFAGSVARLQAAFDEQALVFPSCDSGNAVALAKTDTSAWPNAQELRDAAVILREQTGLNLLPTISRLEKAAG